jgi:hypothetical protein
MAEMLVKNSIAESLARHVVIERQHSIRQPEDICCDLIQEKSA